MRPRFEKLNDGRDAFDHVGSLHYGPFLLVGMTNNASYALHVDIADIDSWLTIDPARSAASAHVLSFTARWNDNGSGDSSEGSTDDFFFKLMPLNRVVDQVYTVHFNVTKARPLVTTGHQSLLTPHKTDDDSSSGSFLGVTADAFGVVYNPPPVF